MVIGADAMSVERADEGSEVQYDYEYSAVDMAKEIHKNVKNGIENITDGNLMGVKVSLESLLDMIKEEYQKRDLLFEKREL